MTRLWNRLVAFVGVFLCSSLVWGERTFVLTPESGDVGTVVQRGIDWSRDTGEHVRFVSDPANKYVKFLTFPKIVPAPGQTQVTVWLTFELRHFGIYGSPPDGTALITTQGLKGGFVKGLALTLEASHTIGLDVSGTDAYRSSGGTTFEDFQVTFGPSVVRSIGMRIGGDRSEGRGDDYSGYRIVNPKFTAPYYGATQEDRLRFIVAARNTGIKWDGSNNQASTVYDVQVSGATIYLTHGSF